MEQQAIKEDTVKFFLEKNILISSELVEKIRNLEMSQAKEIYTKLVEKIGQEDFLVLTKETMDILSENDIEVKNQQWHEFDKNKVLSEKGKVKDIILETKKIAPKKEDEKEKNSETSTISNVKILFSYDEKSSKRDVSQFVSYFRNRYKALSSMLSHRNELENRISISRALAKKDKETISIIGMVSDIQYTKNNNIMITVEDLTNSIKIVINKNRADEMLLMAKNIVMDEVIGVVGVVSNGIIFANNILIPDIPLTKEFKKGEKEEYAAFIGDLHIGSKEFLKKEFSKLIHWFNGRVGDQKQKDLASKIKYLFIVGDLVDGVGVYPAQEADLEIPDIYDQYNTLTKYLKAIPKNIQIIISPGNHDGMRIAEPQPALYKEYAQELYSMENVHFVSNPAIVNVASSDNFSGFDILLYHGYSFTYFSDFLEEIRTKGGLERADLIMQLLLKKRHLAPSHTSNLYIPDPDNDPLIINKIPDFFVTGHIHRTTAKNFNNISLLNCSCWLGQTAFQEKVGLKPQPARLPLANLKTREIKILKFGKDTYTLDDNKNDE